MNCELTDDEKETETSLSINMLQVENDYETPIDSNFYLIKENFNYFAETNSTQNIKKLH